MKISKLFHWLYFSVMALPLVVAPIFALYTTNKNATFDYYVVSEESVTVNAFQYSEFGKPYSLDHYTFNACTGTLNNDRLLVSAPSVNSCSFDIHQNIDLYEHVYYFTFNIFHDNSSNVIVNLYSTDDIIIFEDIFCPYGEDTLFYSNITSDMSETQSNFGFYFLTDDEENFDDVITFSNFQYFDLTEIFGSGNEPTADVFKSYLIESYYNYGNNVLDIGLQNVTYSDTDIGSQFIYSMYNCVDKYFNYDKVINFGDLYTWLNTTFFSGQAPLGFFIFWHLLIYWLLTSLLWLLFDVLIYVPQLVHRWLDKASIS